MNSAWYRLLANVKPFYCWKSISCLDNLSEIRTYVMFDIHIYCRIIKRWTSCRVMSVYFQLNFFFFCLETASFSKLVHNECCHSCAWHRQSELGNRARLVTTASSWYSLAVSIKMLNFSVIVNIVIMAATFFSYLCTPSLNVLSGSYLDGQGTWTLQKYNRNGYTCAWSQ